jgi:hypothetical protein
MGRAISHSCNRPDLFHRASSHRRGPKGVVAMHQLSQSESFRGQVQRAVRKDPASANDGQGPSVGSSGFAARLLSAGRV